ncbi:PaRep2b protein [Pyrobaculum oguniense TE7]|uniref:PaRep2b protein n=1 Tax=Pyrobaculum oguniense (strain DSM 13380 / JCM 10595 / TE7) TaxID=698757 RepID=H6Q803_PYROT|nr:PaRep2b protein [Pyrobaculum oguniense TE7]
MDIDITIFIFFTGVLSSLYLLFFRGREDWYIPLAGSILVLLVPHVTCLVFSWHIPFAACPVYTYGVYDLEEQLRKAAEATEAVANTALSLAAEFAKAIGALSAAMTAAMTILAIASGGLTALLGGALDLLRIMNYANPAWQIAVSAYNVAMGIGMSYHVLAVLAKAAEHFVPLLLAAGMALMPLPRVRGFGAMIFALGLLLYVAAMAGLHFSGPTMEILKWLNSTNKWIGDMPKPSFNFSGYGFLAVQGGGMFFASYETHVDNATVQRALEELRKLGINYTGLAITPGRDYIAGAVLTPIYGGSNITWRGLNSSSPYIVFAWLDVPINGTDRIQRRPWGFDYSLIQLPDNVTVSTPSGNISLREWGLRVAEAERALIGNFTPLWIIDAGPQQFWRLLFVEVNATISLRNQTLYNGTERGVVGVWGWIVPPDEERCEAAGAAVECGAADVTVKPGLLKYEIEANATTWVRPIAERLTSRFNMTLAEAPRPVRDGEERFYTWQEVCYYTCCSTCCDQSGCRTCCSTCSYYRTVWEEPVIFKILRDGEYERQGILYDRPWVPEAPFNFTFRVGYVHRDWEVRKELRASAPDTGRCREIPGTRRLYKKVVFWDVQPSFFMIYGFVWASSVEAAVDDMRRPLPDYYDGGPAEEDGAEVINLLRGAEHDQYCKVAYYGAAQPNWQLVPLAVRNMTSINRMYDAYLLTQGNYTEVWGRGAVAISNGSQFVIEGVNRLIEAYKPKPFIPMPEAAPTNYTMTQVTVECVKYEWRGKSLATGSLTITPGAQVWLHNYTWLASRLSLEFVNKSAEMWLWILQNPPPKPPENLTRWGIVPGWLNSTWLSTPHAFFGVTATAAAGMLLWYAASLLAAWMSIYPQILLAFLSVFAIFEALSWLLGFPSPGIHLMRFVMNTLEDLAFWYQVRLLIRGRVFARALRFLKSPMRAFAILAVRKLYYKGYLRLRAKERWKIESMLGLRYDERVREQIEKRVEEKLTGKRRLERLAEKAKEYAERAAAAAATAAVKTGMATYEAAKAAYKAAKTVHEYTEGDIVHLLRRLSPAVDHKLEAFLEYMAKRYPAVYHLFLAHLDEKPRWISALDLPRLRMLAEAGKIKWEVYQKARNLVEYYYALRAYEKFKAITEKLSEEKVYEMAIKTAQEAAERSEKALRALMYDLARGVAEEEILRRIKAVVQPIEEVYHRGVFAKLTQIVGMALQERPPETPQELAKLLIERRDEVLQRAPIIAEEWRQYWSAREVPYPARERMEAILAEFARVEIASELAELRTAALARRAAYLALEYEQLRKALEAKLGTPEEQALRGRMQELERQMRGVVEEARRMMADRRVSLQAWEAVERGGQYAVEVRNLEFRIKDVRWLERVFDVVKIERIERGGAVEEALSINEKAARKVLEETWRLYHDFGEKYVWLRHGPEERIYAVPKAGVQEVEQALDKALRVYGQHGREAAVAEFRRAVEEAKQFYASRGGVSAVENIEALERRLVKLLEELPAKPSDVFAAYAEAAREEVAGALPGLREAALARRIALLALEHGALQRAVEEKLGTPEEQALRARLEEVGRRLRGAVEEAKAYGRGGLLEKALRAAEPGVDAERAREALEAAEAALREAASRYGWLLEVREAVERALRAYSEGGREAAVEEFRRAVEEVKQRRPADAERIEAVERRIVEVLQDLPERPLSAAPREEVAERLALVERTRQALSDPDAAFRAVQLAREADEITVISALRLSEEAEAVRAFVQRAKSIDYAALAGEANRAVDDLSRQVYAALKAIDDYDKFKAEAALAQDRWLKALYEADAERALRAVKAELELARQHQKRAEEAVSRVKEVEEVKPPSFAGLDFSQDVKITKSEYFLPTDAALYALAIAFTRRLDAVKRAATPEERRKAVAELAAVTELLREYPRERVAMALKEAERPIFYKAGKVEVNTEKAEKLLAALGYAAIAALGRPESYAASVMLEELAKELGVPKDALLKAASISPALAEAVKAVRELASVDKKFAKLVEEAKTERDLEKIRAYLRAEAKALRAASELGEFLKSPSVEANLGYLIFAADRLQLRDVKRVLELIGRAKGELSFFEERYFNVVYEQLLPLLGWRAERMLLRAPPAVYVLNRMGADLAKDVFSRYRGFEAYGSELRDVVPRVDLPLSVGMPVSLKPKFTQYPQRVTRYVADWSDSALASGIRRYYQTEEGRRHRALAEGLAVAAGAAALRKAAERLLEEAQRRDSDALALIAYLTAARAAREELRLAGIFMRAGARVHADAVRRRAGELYATALEKAVEILRRHYDEKSGISQLLVDGLGLYLGRLANVLKRAKTEEDIREAAEKLAGRMHLMRVAAVAEAAGLEELRAPLAHAMEAVRTYLKLEHWLSTKRPAAAPGELRAEAIQALDAPLPKVERRVMEEAVARSVRLWLAEEAGRLARLAQWLEEPYLRAKDKRHREDIRRIREVVEEAWKNAVRKLAEEAKAAAEFSPSALQELKLVAESWAGAGHHRYPAHRLEEAAPPGEGAERLYKYIGMRILQEIRDVQPASRPEAELYERLPQRLRELAEGEVKNVEMALIREGYYDELLRPAYKWLYLPFEREDPRPLFERVAERAAELAKRHGVDPTPLVQAAEELKRSTIRELPKAAERAGGALAEVVSKVVEVVARRRAEELRERGVDVSHDAGFLLSVAKRIIRKISRGLDEEALAVDAVYKWVSRTAEEVNRNMDVLEKAYFEFAVLKTKNREVAEAYARRFSIRPAAADEYDPVEGVFKRREVYLIIHQSLQAAVSKALDWLAGELRDKEEVPVSHMFVGPPELGFILAERMRLAFAREGRYYKYFQFYDLESEVKAIAERLVEMAAEEAAGRPVFWVLRYEHLRRFAPLIAKIYGAEYDPLRDAGYVHKADFAIGYAVMKELLKLLRERVRRGEAKPWEWSTHKDLAEGMAKALEEAVGREFAKPGAAQTALEGVKYAMRYLAGEAPHPSGVAREAYDAAVRLFSLIAGVKEEELWRKTLKLKETNPGQFDSLVELAEERLGLRRREEEREKRPEKPERKPEEVVKKQEEEKPGERRPEAKRPQEEEKPAAEKAGEKPAAAQRPSVKPAKSEERLEAAGQRAAAEAPRGLIPEGHEGVKAVLWLVRASGAELEDASQLVRAAASKLKEKYKAKVGRMEPALAELAEKALEEAYYLVEVAARSRSALEKLRVAFEVGENAVFGLRPETPEEADAAKILADLAKLVRQAEEELGAGLRVWGLAQQFALALIDRVEAEYDRVLKAVTTIERALIPAAVSAMGVVGAIATHDVVLGAAAPIAAAIALAKADQLKEAAKKAKEAAERIYEAARELWEAAKVTLQRIYEVVVEAIARALDYVKAHWFIFAAAAAGLIAWATAQQLDFQLWMEHVAKLAPVIVGAPKFKEFKPALEGEAPDLLKAAERALAWRDFKSIKAFLDEGMKAVLKMQDLKKVVENVNKYGAGKGLRPEHAVDVLALVEAGLKRLGKPPSLAEAAERLAKGERVELDVNEVVEYIKRIRDVAYQLRLLFRHIAENAERYARNKREAEAMKRAFTVTEAAEELAEAASKEFRKLGDATLADKAVAFFESLALGTAWSRVVLNAMEKGKAYEALVWAPTTAAGKYGVGREAVDMWEGLLTRAAVWLAGRGVDKAEFRRKGSQVEIIVNGEAVAVVEIEESEVMGIVYRAKGKWVKEEAMRQLKLARELAEAIKTKPEEYALLALLATDGSYVAENHVVLAGTTSVAQAALYIKLGFKVKYAGYGNLTEEGLKPVFEAWRIDEKIVKRVKEHLAAAEALFKDPGRAELLYKALDLLQEIRWNSAKAKRKAAERITTLLFHLRLGGGKVCLANCQFGEPTLTVKREAYARVVAPLLYYIAREVPGWEGEKAREEVMKFLAHAVLYDGGVEPDQVYLTVGNFGAKSEEKQLPMDIYDKIALYVILAAKYGVGVKGISVREGKAQIRLKPEYAAWVFAAEWPFFSQLLGVCKALGIGADHINKKLEKMKRLVEVLAERIRIEHRLIGDGVVVWFKDESGRELAHINVGWDGESLYAEFGGAKEKAERLALILNALGAEAEARQHGRYWRVELYTDSITAIRRPEWLDAVKALVEALYKNGVISSAKRDELIKEIKAGPNVVEIAGVEMSVAAWGKAGSEKLVIAYHPGSADAFEAAVKALRGAGFEEGVHFTAKRPEEGKKGYIYLKIPAGLWKLEELRRQGVEWAKEAVSRLEEIARERGFYDLLDEYLKPAKEAETIDPKGMVAEDKERGVKAVIRNVKVMWKDGRPKIVVEYEANGRTETFSFTWGVYKSGRVRAGVKLNEEKAAVLAALTGDGKLRGKEGVAELTAKHLFALAKIKDVGWKLLRWYAEVRG